MPVGEFQVKLGGLRPRAELNRVLAATLLETRAQLAAMRGEFAPARELIAEASRLASEHGFAVEISRGTLPAAGAIELLAGRPAAAEPPLRAACEGMDHTGELGYLSSVAPLLVDALHELGRDDEALELSDRWHVDRLTVPEDADAHIAWRRSRAKVLASRGELVEAKRLAREAVTIAAGTDFLDARAQAAADLGEVLRVAGNAAEAQVMRQDAIRLYEAKGNVAAVARIRDRVAAWRTDHP